MSTIGPPPPPAQLRAGVDAPTVMVQALALNEPPARLEPICVHPAGPVRAVASWAMASRASPCCAPVGRTPVSDSAWEAATNSMPPMDVAGAGTDATAATTAGKAVEPVLVVGAGTEAVEETTAGVAPPAPAAAAMPTVKPTPYTCEAEAVKLALLVGVVDVRSRVATVAEV